MSPLLLFPLFRLAKVFRYCCFTQLGVWGSNVCSLNIAAIFRRLFILRNLVVSVRTLSLAPRHTLKKPRIAGLVRMTAWAALRPLTGGSRANWSRSAATRKSAESGQLPIHVTTRLEA